MKFTIVIVLGIAVVSAIDLRMCQRNCRMNDHYCRLTGAPGQTSHFCMQKKNECNVGCVQNCKKACSEKFSVDTCVEECQYRGSMMLEMGMDFDGPNCMNNCMWSARRCNMRCDDNFGRMALHRPLMEYIYPEQLQQDWTVMTGLMDNPNREPEPQYPSFTGGRF